MSVPSTEAPPEPARERGEGVVAQRPHETRALPMFGLRPVWMVALTAVVATIFGRAIIPALRGAVIGISDFIDRADLIVGTLSLFLAFLLGGSIAGLAFELARSRLALSARTLAVVVSVPVVVSATLSMLLRLPPLASLGLTASASTLAIALGLEAMREKSTRRAALVPCLIGLASLLRGVGAFAADHAATVGRDVDSIVSAYELARIVATASLALWGIALVVTATWLAQQEWRFFGARTLVVVLATVILTRAASAPVDDLTPIWQVVARRAAQGLLTRPPPHVPDWVAMGIAIFAPLLAAALLTLRRVVTAISGGLALVVLVGGSAEVPILAMCLIAGTIALVLAGRDPRGVWAALLRS